MAIDNENPMQSDSAPDQGMDPQAAAIAQKYGVTPDQMQSTAVTPTYQDRMNMVAPPQPYNIPQMTPPAQQQEQQPFLSQYPLHQFLTDRYNSYQKGIGGKAPAPWDMEPADYKKAVDDYIDGPVNSMLTQRFHDAMRNGRLPAGSTLKENVNEMKEAYREQLHRELPDNLDALQKHFAAMKTASAPTTALPATSNSTMGDAGSYIMNHLIPAPITAGMDAMRAIQQQNETPGAPPVTLESGAKDVLTGAARGGSTALRGGLMAAAGALPLLPGMNPLMAQEGQNQIFAANDTMRGLEQQLPQPTGTGSQILQGIGAIPPGILSLGSGNSAQAADILAKGGSLARAEGENALGAATNIATLPLGAVGKNPLVRGLIQGTGATGAQEIERRVKNSLLPPDQQEAFDPVSAGLTFGAGLGMGMIPHGETKNVAPKPTGEGNTSNTGESPTATPSTGAEAIQQRSEAARDIAQRARLAALAKGASEADANTQALQAYHSALNSDLPTQTTGEAAPATAAPVAPLDVKTLQGTIDDFHRNEGLAEGTGETPQERWDSPEVQQNVQDILKKAGPLSPEDTKTAVDTIKDSWADAHDVNPDEVVPKTPTPVEAAPASPEDALAAAVAGKNEVTPQTPTEPQLPGPIRNARPKFGLDEPQFASDVDKALYIIRAKSQSRAHDQYMDFLKSVFPGETEEQIKARGAVVHEAVKAASKGAVEGTFPVPRVTELPTRAAPKATEAAPPEVHGPTVESLLASKQETQRTNANGRAAKGRLPVEFVNPDDKLAYLYKQMGSDPTARSIIEQELIRRGYSTEQISDYADAVSKRVVAASKDPLRSNIILSSGAPAKEAGNVLTKKGRGAAEEPRNEVLYSRRGQPEDLSKLKPTGKAASEPIFAKDGSHENPNRAYTGNRIKPRHAVDEMLMKLRTFDRDNPTRSEKMKWLMREAFPGESADDIYDKSKQLYRATTAEARDNENLTPRQKVDLGKATQRRPVDFSTAGKEGTSGNGIPEGLPGGKTPATVFLAKQMGGSPDIEAVKREAMPPAVRAAFEAFEKATKTKIEVVRGKNGTNLDFNGATLRNGVLYLNEASNKPLIHVAGHEWSHQLEVDNPVMYKALEAEVKRQGYLDKYTEELKQRGADTSRPERELTADAVGDAMGDPDFLKKLAEKNPTTFRDIATKFINYLSDLAGKIRDATLGSAKFLPELEKFRDLLASHLENYKGPEGSEKAATAEPVYARTRTPEEEARAAQLRAITLARKNGTAAPAAATKPYVEPSPKLKVNGKTIDPEKIQQIITKSREPGQIAKALNSWSYLAMLTHLRTLPKILATSTGELGLRPIEEIIGTAISKIPGISDISDIAPRYGGSLSVEGAKSALANLTNWQAYKDMARTGSTYLDSAFKESLEKHRDLLESNPALKEEVNNIISNFQTGIHQRPELINLPGRIHGLLHSPPMLAEHAYSLVKRQENLVRSLQRQGLSDKAIMAAVSHPLAELDIQLGAYKDALSAAYRGDNLAIRAYNNSTQWLRANGGGVGGFIANVLDFMNPFMRVSSNLFSRGTDILVGAAKAGVEYNKAQRRIAVNKQLQEAGRKMFPSDLKMKPEEADYIMRTLRSQGVGAMAVALGAMFYKSFGGLYQKDQYNRKDKPEQGTMTVGDTKIPSILLEHPLLQVMQLSAMVTRGFMEKGAKGGGNAALAGVKDFGDVLSFSRSTGDLSKALENSDSFLKYVSQQVLNRTIPGVVSDSANVQDLHDNATNSARDDWLQSLWNYAGKNETMHRMVVKDRGSNDILQQPRDLLKKQLPKTPLNPKFNVQSLPKRG